MGPRLRSSGNSSAHRTAWYPEDAVGLLPDALEVRREPREHLAGVTDGKPLQFVGEPAKVADEGGLAGLDLRDDVGYAPSP